MIESELVDEVLSRLPTYWRTRMGAGRKKLVRRILRIAYTVVMETTARGESLRINNFCVITAKEFPKRKVDQVDIIRIVMKPSAKWRRLLHSTIGLPWKSTDTTRSSKKTA